MPSADRPNWFSPLLRSVLARRSAASTTESGVTLIESLVAIIVIGITAALITPPLFIATASRSQNRKAEQANQIAQAEVDRIRVLVSNGQHEQRYLPDIAGAFAAGTIGSEGVIPPSNAASLMQSPNASCNTYNPYTDIRTLRLSALRIDVDGNCETNFYMQVFRDRGVVSAREQGLQSDPNQQRPSTFRLAVRVWSNAADGNWAQITTPVAPASLQITSGQGQQRLRPLAVVNSRMSWSDIDSSLEDMRNPASRL
ncbi:MAG: prepilin-type N-terminal cleavage/methylation domain-containing protein [Kaiparowitsia implicata GSE-PSE-MK54-09C]|nr:prepilin-type N-terminal cleavage/methylation domain-containing protein [Kaiparowitsia implicata GSE-PSE-MK54-09C]